MSQTLHHPGPPCDKDCEHLVPPQECQPAGCNGIGVYMWTMWTGDSWEAFPGWPCPKLENRKKD